MENGKDRRLASLSSNRRALFDAIIRGESKFHEAKVNLKDSPPQWSIEQETLWHRTKNDSGPGNNLYCLFRLKGPLDSDKLKAALVEIARRHKPLRASFHQNADVLSVKIWDEPNLNLQVFSLEQLDPSKREREALQKSLEIAEKPFDLAIASLARVTLFKLSGDDHMMMILADHMIADGWSYGLMLKELSALYSAGYDRWESLLPDLVPSYFDLSLSKRQELTEEKRAAALDFWSSHLAHSPEPVLIPADKPRGVVQAKISSIHLDFENFLIEDLNETAKLNNATPFAVFISAIFLLLWKKTGKSDILIKSVSSGRGNSYSNSLIGIFTKVLLLRAKISPQDTIEDYIKSVFRMSSMVQSHEDGPGVQDIFEEMVSRGIWKQEPHVSVSVVFQNFPNPGLNLPNISCDIISMSFGNSDQDVEISVFPNEDKLRIVMQYNSAIFSVESMYQFLKEVELVLEFLKMSHRRVGDAQRIRPT